MIWLYPYHVSLCQARLFHAYQPLQQSSQLFVAEDSAVGQNFASRELESVHAHASSDSQWEQMYPYMV